MNRHTTVHGTFQIDAMPAQPQLALCHGFFVPIRQRGRKFGHQLKRQQMQLLAAENYDYGICTVDAGNAAQLAVLTKAGWRMLDEFANSKTGGKTQIWGSPVGNDAPANGAVL